MRFQKRRVSLNTALALSLLGLGSMSAQTNQASPVVFSGYRELFAHIAVIEHVSTDADSVFALAAESTITLRPTNDPSLLFEVVAPNYYHAAIANQLRGAGANGSFYIVRVGSHADKRMVDLVGVVYGNTFKWEERSDTTHGSSGLIPVLVVSERMSGTETKTTRFLWDGSKFARMP